MAAGLGYKEFTTGDVLTAADANGYLASQVVMVFASAAARTSAIASPQEGMISFLKDTNSTEYYSGSAWVAIGGASSPTFVGCFVYGTANQTVSNTTVTVIPFAAENFDTDGFHSTSVNNSRVTIPAGKAGKYLVIARGTFSVNGTGFRQTRVLKNGTAVQINVEVGNSTTDTQTNASYILDLAVADYLEIAVYQNTGGNLVVTASNDNETSMQVSYLGA